ncbi:hypothetical protein GGI12_002814 [Dipsacomyces acuminosporus]|nr:hypothetical protein GGI12_002814 [Dipsacomyces acuminosporus]
MLRDAQSGECVRSLKDSDFAVTSLDINSQGTKVLTSSMNSRMSIWNISDEDGSSPELTINAGQINAWKSRFVTEDIIASSTDKGTVRLWSSSDGQPVGELNTSRPSFLYALAASPDGTKVACAGVSSHVYVFDVSSGALACTFSGHSDTVRSISFSADSSMLVTASDDKQIQLHDVRHGSPVTAFIGHAGWVLSAEMHPNGTYIASGSVDSKVKLWDIAQRACVETHTKHAQAVWSVAWQRSSEDVLTPRPMLASAGEDCIVNFYDPLLA